MPMDKYKQHITFLLAFVFFWIQGGQTLHYLLVVHDYSIAENSFEKNISEENRIHHCDHKIYHHHLYNTAFLEITPKNIIVYTRGVFSTNNTPLKESSQVLPKPRGPPFVLATIEKTT